MTDPACCDAASQPLAWREREYSPSSCIGGNYAPYVQIYADLSRLALARHRAQRDLAYAQAEPGSSAQRLDLFLPETPARNGTRPPLLVFIHGGYWQELSKEESLFAALHCLPHGVAFAALDYSLAPQASLADMARECRQALRWLHSQAERLGFDPHRMVLAGSSAGAHLSAMCSLRGWSGDADLPLGVPAAALLVSGIYELAPLLGTSIDAQLQLPAKALDEISPQRLGLTGFAPAVVCWGSIETQEFKRQSQAFAQALQQAGAAVQCFEVAGRNHFDVVLDLAVAGTALGDASLHALGVA